MLNFQKALKEACHDKYAVSMLIKLCMVAADSRLLAIDDLENWQSQRDNIEKMIAILKAFEEFEDKKSEIIRIKNAYFELGRKHNAKLLFDKSAALNSMIGYFEKNNDENSELHKGISAAISFLGNSAAQLQQKITLLSPPVERQKVGVFLEPPLKPYLPQVTVNRDESSSTPPQTSTVLSPQK